MVAAAPRREKPRAPCLIWLGSAARTTRRALAPGCGGTYAGADCSSYFIDANGRNGFNWPWSTGEFATRIGGFRPEAWATTAPAQNSM